MMATKVGSLKNRVIHLDGSGIEITAYEVKFIPKFWVNLFGINKALKNGHLLSNQGLSSFLSNVSISVTFDRVMTTTNGSVSGIKLLVNDSPIVYNTISGPLYGKKVDISEFHNMLGHCGSNRLKNNAKIHEFKLNGEFKTCEQCDIAKCRQKNINKDWKG
jgi:hypothetical protein